MIFAKEYSHNPIILSENANKVILRSNYPCEYPESSKIPVYFIKAENCFYQQPIITF